MSSPKSKSKSSRRAIVRDIDGDRYLLTSRRIVQLDSVDAQEGTPWFANNKDIREVSGDGVPLSEMGEDYLRVRSYTQPKAGSMQVSVFVRIGRTPTGDTVYNDRRKGTFHIGCGYFEPKVFQRILRNAGVKVAL